MLKISSIDLGNYWIISIWFPFLVFISNPTCKQVIYIQIHLNSHEFIVFTCREAYSYVFIIFTCREAISRVCEAAGLKNATKRQKKVSNLLPNVQHDTGIWISWFIISWAPWSTFQWNLIQNETFLHWKMHLKVSFAKCCDFVQASMC